ncbi:sugar ABC transporter permease [Okibacterium endophyticum]
MTTTHREARAPGGPRFSSRGLGWLYLTPVILAIGLWIYGPAVATAVLSVMEWNLTTPPEGFVGIDNLARLVTQPEFGPAIGQTALYALALLPFSTVVPLVFAVMLWSRPGRASTVYRSLLFLPVMVAPVAVAVSWRFLLNPLNGFANEVIGWFGLSPVNWLGDPALALPVIVVVTAARVTAFNMLLYSAALSGIDRNTLDAARIDRANPVQIGWHIVMPQLFRPIVLLAFLSFVLAGQWVFTNVSVLTQGGPDGATDNVYYRIYTLGFEFFETGMASAAAVLVLVFFAASGALWLFVRRSSDDD